MMQLRYRKLRIAWSVTWGMVAVLLCMLWVRSYFRYDWVVMPQPRLNLYSYYGTFAISHRGTQENWALVTNDIDVLRQSGHPFYWQYFVNFRFNPALVAPYWCLVVLFAFVATAPWTRPHGWRFSVRTLLIVTTVVAIALGALIWASKNFPVKH